MDRNAVNAWLSSNICMWGECTQLIEKSTQNLHIKFCRWGGKCSEDLVRGWNRVSPRQPSLLLGASRREQPLLFREKDPTPFSPRSATFNRANSGPRRADQLAGPVQSLIEGLRHGPPIFLSVGPVGRPADGGQVEPLHLFCWLLSPVPSSSIQDGFPLIAGGNDRAE